MAIAQAVFSVINFIRPTLVHVHIATKSPLGSPSWGVRPVLEWHVYYKTSVVIFASPHQVTEIFGSVCMHYNDIN